MSHRKASPPFFSSTASKESGLTFIEVLLGGLTLAISLSAVLGAYVGQVTLNEHARNLSFLVQDANRVIEEIRQQNTGCSLPRATPPLGADWDTWLQAQTSGKSLGTSDPQADERVIVTCSHADGPAAGLCGPNQVGAEWAIAPAHTAWDPLRVTVSVCWRHRSRTIGECSYNGTTLAPGDGANGPNALAGTIESPVMLTTLITCRG